MSEPTTFEIVIRGRASARLLRPLLDDFTFGHAADGNTHLIGEVRDAAHLHGVVAHMTSVNVELVSIVPIDRLDDQLHHQPVSTQPETSTH
jgi:hypothetical protein